MTQAILGHAMTRIYSLDELKTPAVYQSDPQLERVAKRVALMTFDRLGKGRVSLGDYRAEVLAGKQANAVREYLERDALRGGELHKVLALNGARLLGLEAAFGIEVRVDVPKGMVHVLNAGRDSYLETAVRKAGGWRVDGNTLATRLVHAHDLRALLEQWYLVRRRQSASATLKSREAARLKGRVSDA